MLIWRIISENFCAKDASMGNPFFPALKLVFAFTFTRIGCDRFVGRDVRCGRLNAFWEGNRSIPCETEHTFSSLRCQLLSALSFRPVPEIICLGAPCAA